MQRDWSISGSEREWTAVRDAHHRAFAAAISAVLLDPASDGRGLLVRLSDIIRVSKVERAGATDDARSALFRIRTACGWVRDAAGEMLLRWPDFARAHVGEAAACRAFASLGHRGIEFAADLFRAAAERQPDARRPFYCAIADVGRDDRETVEALAALATCPDGAEAIDALVRIGPSVLRFAPTLIDDLLPAADADDVAAAWRLSQPSRLDSTRRDLFDRLLRLARVSPPQVLIRDAGNGRSYPSDAVMLRRGHALSALARFDRFADDAVPVLVGALATFREFDPMWECGRGRIGTVLDQLGRGDAMIPAVLRHPPTPRPAGG